MQHVKGRVAAVAAALLAGVSGQVWAGVTGCTCAPRLTRTSDLDAARVSNAHEVVGEQAFESLPPIYKDMILRLLDGGSDVMPIAPCFTPGTPDEVIAAFNAAMRAVQPRYNQAARWGPTALDPGSTGAQGTPTVLTYSFVPDGTALPSGAGEPAAPSDLFAAFNALYGSPAAWQAHYHSIFQRWGELAGITFVYEPNDDGAAMNEFNNGVAGVRGDLRMAGHFIDGNSGVLAWNYYPQVGDMVVDTADNFYATTTNNSLRLRNVLAHEHGHGMGQAHVCPVQQTKLMEPFISTAYDGPRHDDIRNAHRHYGDVNEPDNTAAQATPLGTLIDSTPATFGIPPAPAVLHGSTLSIDADSEQDWFSFTVGAPRTLNVTVTPVGLNYEDTPQACSGQSGSCCSGEFTNSLAITNLNVQIIASNGVTVLATGNASPAGIPEALTQVALPSAGTYYIRVYEGDSPVESQLYTLTVEVRNDAFSISLPSGPPQIVAPGTPAPFPVVITPGTQSIVPGSPTLFFRGTGGSFQAAALTSNGGNNYTAILPGFNCSATPEFYVSAQGSGGAVITSPVTAPTSFYSARVGVETIIFSDNFETNLGWAVQNVSVTDGAWNRGVPAGDGTRGDPTSDFDGSGQCYLTDNTAGNSDVDGGPTRLLSPLFNLASANDPTLSYARWFANDDGDIDRLTVELSNNNGSTWTLVESVANSPGWTYRTVRIRDFVTLTGQVRVRFNATDNPNDSVTEAGVDAVSIVDFVCVNPPCGSADFDGDGDSGTDADIEAFFACLGGSCCATCGTADFDGDGDSGTDADIEAFFRVLGGGTC